jgi:N-acetylgalactosamine kinase
MSAILKARTVGNESRMEQVNNNNHKSVAQQTMVIILAAGKGTRMGRSDMAKVCFEIDGVPAINRLIETFKKNRFEKFMVVVGSMAEQVMQTVGQAHPDTIFVCQTPQLGTGHAGKVAAEALQTMEHEGPVLLTLGDKYIEPVAAEMLLDGFVRQQADLLMLTIPRTRTTEQSSGRVMLDNDGQAVTIIERMDLARQAVADEIRKEGEKNGRLTGKRIQELLNKHIENPRKQVKACPELAELAKQSSAVSGDKLNNVLSMERYNIAIDGQTYTAQQIEKICKHFNPSMYMFTDQAFYRGMSLIDNNNAQKEYYLPDVVRHLNAERTDEGDCRYRVRTVQAEKAELIQGFNSPEELLSIQDHVRRSKLKQGDQNAATLKPKLKNKHYSTVNEWLNKIKANAPALRKWMERIYGKHESLHEAKRKELTKVLKCYGQRFGYDQKVVIVRAPGRMNLMGRHVDHRGGCNNFLALDRETIMVAGLRDDDNVVAVSTQPQQFKTREFNISELIGRFAWSDWVNFVDSDWVRNLLYSNPGDWSNYIKAAMVKLQHEYTDLKIRGLNIALYGSVPIAAGLSSSSTIVVATLQAAIALNNLELTSRQFIDLCGEGEWFVGSRGGAGDHAAIYLGQRGKIAQVAYLPFRVERIIDAPPEYQVMIANSHIKAAKSGEAKDQFNSRVACYNLGMALLKQRCSEIAPVMEHLRDLDPEKLACSTSDIYRYLLRIPETMTRRDFRNALSSEYHDLMEANFASHKDIGDYPVRGVLLFGAAECMRSKLCMKPLAEGNVARFGELMRISHDGDRVSRAAGDGKYEPWVMDCSTERLNQLIADLASEDPERVLNAQLYMQPGLYACSTEEIDRMVDIACNVPGVAGAQIAGAGLGGCIMILTRKDATDAVRRALNKHYYKPRGLKPAAFKCTTADGAGLAEF